GLFHQDACGGETGLPAENAVSRTDLALFAAPDGGEALRTVPAGRRLAVTGEPRDGFYPVTHGATAGWAAGDALLFDGGDSSAVLYTSAQVDLRNGPSLANEVLRELPAGTELARTGSEVDGFAPVAHGGVVGWVAAAYLS
ncbi:MAG: SH3 domain-containing protein, partial [Chloroflexota bacterium]|nr:SH3 domain-containing protein [Chloroflexota bacterium]